MLQINEFYWADENAKVVKVRAGGLRDALSPPVDVLGAKLPNEYFSFSKDARLAKTGKKILLYKLADLSLILKKKTKGISFKLCTMMVCKS